MRRKSENWPLTRPSLLKEIKDWENQESWKVFFDTYSRLVRSFANGRDLSDYEADEVVSETFITVMKKIKEFEYDPAKGSFRSWLLTTASWKIWDQRRDRKHQARPSDTSPGERRTKPVDRIPDPASVDSNEGLKGELAGNLFTAAVEKVKHQVSADQFQIFDLYALKDWPVSKVTSTLSINENQVYLAKHRVLELIKKELKAWSKSPGV